MKISEGALFRSVGRAIQAHKTIGNKYNHNWTIHTHKSFKRLKMKHQMIYLLSADLMLNE